VRMRSNGSGGFDNVFRPQDQVDWRFGLQRRPKMRLEHLVGPLIRRWCCLAAPSLHDCNPQDSILYRSDLRTGENEHKDCTAEGQPAQPSHWFDAADLANRNATHDHNAHKAELSHD